MSDTLEQAMLESELALADETLITPVNEYLLIDPETRLIEVPESESLFGVYSENDVEVKHFACPKIVLNNIDLSQMYIFINYVSASGRYGQTLAKNIKTSEDGNYITFDWELTGNVFDKNTNGKVYFAVMAKKQMEDKNPVFATRKASGDYYETIEAGEVIQEQHADIILEMLTRIETLENGGTGGSSFSGNAYDVSYDDTKTKLGVDNVQDAIGKLSEEIGDLISAEFVVDLGKYNIQSMESHLPPFTDEEYLIAYNNVNGLNEAFKDAYDNGFGKVVVPRGKYPLLYQNNDNNRFSNSHYYSIKLQNNMEYDFNHSQMWMMFDSDNPNPYYIYNDTNYYKQSGKVIGLSHNENITIRNLTVTGERELRSYTNTSEKNVENTTGICVIDESYNVKIVDVITESFMADGFSMVTSYGNKGIACSNYNNFTQGFIHPTSGGLTPKTSYPSFYTDYLDISSIAGNYANIWSGIGYQYVLSSKPNMFVAFYDSEKTFISGVFVMQCYPFYVPLNAVYMVIQFIDLNNVGITTQSFRVTNLTSGNFLLENVVMRNNCRGGASNVPNFTTFRKCKFYHNGKTSFGGKPQFGDSTRYAIDIEDIQSAGLVIDDCDEYDNGNGGFFLGAIDCTITNSRISRISFYRGVAYHITNSTLNMVGASGSDLISDKGIFAQVSNSLCVCDGNDVVELDNFQNCDIVAYGGIFTGKSINNRIRCMVINQSVTPNVNDKFTFMGEVYDFPLNSIGKIIKGVNKHLSTLLTTKTEQVIKLSTLRDVTVVADNIGVASQNQTQIKIKDSILNANTCLFFQCTNSVATTIGDTYVFENCEINTPNINLYKVGTTEIPLGLTFKNCTFNVGDISAETFLLTIPDSKVYPTKFKNCTFINETENTCYVSTDEGISKMPITFDNCTFENVTPYPSYTV